MHGLVGTNGENGSVRTDSGRTFRRTERRKRDRRSQRTFNRVQQAHRASPTAEPVYCGISDETLISFIVPKAVDLFRPNLVQHVDQPAAVVKVAE